MEHSSGTTKSPSLAETNKQQPPLIQNASAAQPVEANEQKVHSTEAAKAPVGRVADLGEGAPSTQLKAPMSALSSASQGLFSGQPFGKNLFPSMVMPSSLSQPDSTSLQGTAPNSNAPFAANLLKPASSMFPGTLTAPNALLGKQANSKDKVTQLGAPLASGSKISFGSLPGLGAPGADLASSVGGGFGGLMGGPLNFEGHSAQQESKQGGELINGTYHTYHGIDMLAPQLSQDLDMSPDSLGAMNVLKTKLFRNKTDSLLCFLGHSANNVSLLLNQQDLCEKVVSANVLSELNLGKSAEIIDFTVVQFRYLVVLLKSAALLVFDCERVLNGHERQVRFMFMQKLELDQSSPASQGQPLSLTRVEALEDGTPRSLLVFGKQSAPIIFVTFSDFECTMQSELEIPSGLENRQIVDLCIWDNKAAFLFDKNAIAVFELTTRTVVFRATYADATNNISNIYFVSEHSQPSAHSSKVAPEAGMLSGFFLMTETKMQVNKNEAEKVSSRTKLLRKLHLVEIQQSEVKVKKNIERRDRLEQVDELTFGSENPKLVDFVVAPQLMGTKRDQKSNFFVFLLNRERVKQSGLLRLFTVKLNWASSDKGGNNDDDEIKDTKQSSNSESLCFEYVTEVMPKISNFSGEKLKPDYMKVLPVVDPNDQKKGETCFYVYVGVGNRTVVFKKQWGEVCSTIPDSAREYHHEPQEREEYKKKQSSSQKATTTNSKDDDADEIIRKIEEESIKEKQDLDDQLDQKVKEALEEIDDLSHKTTSMSTFVDPAIQQIYKTGKDKPSKEEPQKLNQPQSKASKKNKQQPGDPSAPSKKQAAAEKQASHKRKTSVASGSTDQQNQMQSTKHAQQPGSKAQATNDSNAPQGSQVDPPSYEVKTPVGPRGGKTKEQNKDAQPVTVFKNKAALKQEAAAAAAAAAGSQDKVYVSAQQLQNAQQKETVPKNKQNQKGQAQSSQGAASAQNNQSSGGQVAASVQVPQSRKAQQEQIIDNYTELAKKFTELHMKMNSLQQQVKSQKDLQIQVEQSVTRAVKSALPEMVKKQVEETITPILQHQQEIIDTQMRTSLLPRIEAHISRAFGGSNTSSAQSHQMQAQAASINSANAAGASASGGPVVNSGKELQAQPSVSSDQVKKIVKAEFKDVMQSAIVPELEKILKGMLGQVREPLINLNRALCEKLVSEEYRSDYMVQLLNNKLQQIHSQQPQHHHQHQQHSHQQPQTPHMQMSYTSQGSSSPMQHLTPHASFYQGANGLGPGVGVGPSGGNGSSNVFATANNVPPQTLYQHQVGPKIQTPSFNHQDSSFISNQPLQFTAQPSQQTTPQPPAPQPIQMSQMHFQYNNASATTPPQGGVGVTGTTSAHSNQPLPSFQATPPSFQPQSQDFMPTNIVNQPQPSQVATQSASQVAASAGPRPQIQVQAPQINVQAPSILPSVSAQAQPQVEPVAAAIGAQVITAETQQTAAEVKEKKSVAADESQTEIINTENSGSPSKTSESRSKKQARSGKQQKLNKSRSVPKHQSLDAILSSSDDMDDVPAEEKKQGLQPVLL